MATGAALNDNDVEQGIVCDFEHDKCRRYQEAEIRVIEQGYKRTK